MRCTMECPADSILAGFLPQDLAEVLIVQAADQRPLIHADSVGIVFFFRIGVRCGRRI